MCRGGMGYYKKKEGKYRSTEERDKVADGNTLISLTSSLQVQGYKFIEKGMGYQEQEGRYRVGEV